MIKKKKIAILGVTGSIGTQAIQVLMNYPDDAFELVLMSAHTNWESLYKFNVMFEPQHTVITDVYTYQHLVPQYWKGKVHGGMDVLCTLLEELEIDLVLTAMVGMVGLKPTLVAVNRGIDIALANKETLVVAGHLIMPLAIETGSKIIPVDSEHSALFQCLVGEEASSVEKLILTASGGPFRGYTQAQLAQVTLEQALKHPNWSMGHKITIDSATLMNKGLEVIEAKWLFDVHPEQLEVVVHPQSIIHSMVQFKDGSIKAQMGCPDMKLPIHYAFMYPDRQPSDFKRFSFLDTPTFTFEAPDLKTFEALALAYKALELGGTMPCVLNTANEIAVDLFLKQKLQFLDIPSYISDCLSEAECIANPSLEVILELDQQLRHNATQKFH